MAELDAISAQDVREQLRAISRVQRAVAGEGGLQPVLDEVIKAAVTLCEGEYGVVYLAEAEVLRASAYYVAEESESPIAASAREQWAVDREHEYVKDRSTLTGRVALTREVVHLPDMLADPEYTHPLPAGSRAGLGVPILLDDELIGAIVIVRGLDRPFASDEIELVETFAAQAAIAIRNARLLETVERQLIRQQAVAGVMRSVVRAQGLQVVLDDVVGAAARLCEAENGRLWLFRDDLLHVVANHGSRVGYEYDQQPREPDRSTMAGRAAVTRDVVHLPDVEADPEYTYAGPRYYRSGLHVPIVLDDELIGVIGITRVKLGPFPEEHIELVKTFADQAAIAIANARLIDAVETQLEQQRAISDVLGVVARAEGLQAVFDAVLQTAGRLCSADYGQICLTDGDVFRAVGAYGTAEELFEYEQAHPTPRDRSTLVGRVGVTGDTVHIPDIREDPEYSWGTEMHVYRAMLGVPIFIDDELIGVINVVRDEPGPYTDEQIELVKTFADQAAIAIANARLLDALEKQLEQQKAVADVLGAVARAEGLDSVLHAVVEVACRLCEAEFGALHLIDGEFLRIAAGHGGPPELYKAEQENPRPIAGDRTSVSGRVLMTRDLVHIPDIDKDPEYASPKAAEAGIRALLGAPLIVEGQLVGVFNIVRTEPASFTSEQMELLRTFADQAAIAVANARLMEAVERQLDQQRAISDVFGVVARSEGLDSVFTGVVEAATELCHGGYGGLYILEDGALHARAYCGDSKQYEYELDHPHPIDRKTLVGRVGLTRDVVNIPNLGEDPDYDWPLLLGHQAGLGVPIVVEGELIGVISVTRTPESFTDDEVELVGTFADQAAIAIANARLLGAVERQSAELSRFVSPQVADLISSDEGQKMLAGHRAYVTSLFCDLRGFTSFTELAEPEELFEVLREYHLALGELIPRYQGTLEHFAGDGLMVFFNDPLPVEEHELKAVELALAAQERFEELASSWSKRGHELGLGIGIAAGYATLGRIGFEGRYDYGVLGTVTNLASRLSDRAEPGEVLISQRVYAAVEEQVEAEPIGDVELKGFGRPVVAYNVSGVRQA